jgi:hypothetical protein
MLCHMQHAAKKRQEATAGPATAGPVGATACLHLQRGSSSQATWFLEDVPGGTTLSIGADPTCDWQLRAACVPPHAVSVLLLSGNLFVRSSCEGDVQLDGSPLGDNWVAVHHGARLDIGFAQLVIACGAKRSAFDAASLGTLSYTEPQAASQLGALRRKALSTETRLGFPIWSESGTQPASGTQLVGDQPAPAQRAALRVDARELNDDQQATLNRQSRSFAPSLLGDERRGPSGVWLYILAGLATLFAYAGWVVALDRF